MSTSNPIIALLANEKLTGDNFIKWKSNMNIVLVSEDYKFVLTEECPPQPAANATRAARESYEKWTHANNKARCYMLAGMTDVLRAKHERMETAYEVMESLQVMFGQQPDQSRYDTIKKAMNAKMKRGTPVRDHVLNMINYFGEAEVHGTTIDDRTQVSMILESLSLDFLQFKSNYVMNKLNYTMTQLLNELQTFESISKDKGKDGSATVAEANVAEENPSTSNKNKKRKIKGASGSKPKKRKKGNTNTKKNNSKDKKPKGKYFHCRVEGHWKRNCNKYLSELIEKKKGKYDLLVLEDCLVEEDLFDISSEIVDSGATNHVCSSFQILSSSRELADGEFTMRVGNGAKVSAKAVGVV
ncbi:hypothetical protein TorRG33x02_148520, partial [Trema orientale]